MYVKFTKKSHARKDLLVLVLKEMVLFFFLQQSRANISERFLCDPPWNILLTRVGSQFLMLRFLTSDSIFMYYMANFPFN